MKVLVFVMDGLTLKHCGSNSSANRKLDEDLTNVYVYWIQMYIYSRNENFSESMLIEFEVYRPYTI